MTEGSAEIFFLNCFLSHINQEQKKCHREKTNKTKMFKIMAQSWTKALEFAEHLCMFMFGPLVLLSLMPVVLKLSFLS